MHLPEVHAVYLDRDREFHWQLGMISGNRYLTHAMEAVNVMVFTYQYGLNRPMAEVIQEHYAILDGLRKQDPDASEAAMRLHVGRTRERIDQLADEEEALAKLTPDWPGGSAFPGPSRAMVPR